MRESRWCGRRCAVVDDRQRPCGGEDRFDSVIGFGGHMRPPQGHVSAVPDSALPGVHSITESRTLYL